MEMKTLILALLLVLVIKISTAYPAKSKKSARITNKTSKYTKGTTETTTVKLNLTTETISALMEEPAGTESLKQILADMTPTTVKPGKLAKRIKRIKKLPKADKKISTVTPKSDDSESFTDVSKDVPVITPYPETLILSKASTSEPLPEVINKLSSMIPKVSEPGALMEVYPKESAESVEEIPVAMPPSSSNGNSNVSEEEETIICNPSGGSQGSKSFFGIFDAIKRGMKGEFTVGSAVHELPDRRTNLECSA